ncbi:MAG: hypothetical protein NTV51_04110 [Verrucomicrobia bacterium]|nr:hypothetical protein [Verrucomicrobiota bacterium]
MNLNSPYWFELAVVFGLSWLGSILLSAFAEQETRTRRIGKALIGAALALVVSATAGREWFFVLVGVFFVVFAVIHGWWLPRQGVNGWTAEPRERYRALRGWTAKR